jgi:Ca-activated chloride channel family protein
MGAAGAAAQGPVVFRAEVAAVHVDVFVTSRSRPVGGLRAEDFEVLDNGVRQAVTLVAAEAVPVEALLVFDTSGSVRGAKLADLKAAARTFVDGLGPRDEVDLLAFSHELRGQGPSRPARAALREALEGLGAGGATALYDALYVAFRRPSGAGRPMIVLFTDGDDNRSWLGPEELREANLRSNALLYVVATASPKSRSALLVRELAEATGGRYWRAESSRRLQERFLDILDEMRTRYLLSYEPRGVERTGRHRLEVKVKGRKAEVRHRREYVVSGPSPGR